MRFLACASASSSRSSLVLEMETRGLPPPVGAPQRIARDPAVCTMAGSENPFANADAWRRHPLLTGTWKHVAPGFFIGLAGITAYIAYDKASSKKTAKH